VGKLMDKGHAYEENGSVYFRVKSFKPYGRLANLKFDEMKEGAGGFGPNERRGADEKENSRDFALWKAFNPLDGEVVWNAKWGRGRPGWHIECSAMCNCLLGPTIDIHAGGVDLVFPHHENEIAQSRCSHNGAPLANVWMHNGFLTINNDKMSKSLGNFFTVRQLLEKYHGEVIRLALLTAHYRQPLDFSEEGLSVAKARLDRWYGALRDGKFFIANPDRISPPLHNEFESSLGDDLNTPLAISLIDKQTSIYREAEFPEKAGADLVACGNALGLLQENPDAWFKWQPANQSGISESNIQAQIDARVIAKKSKNFAEADRIRDSLLQQDIILEDSATGTTWRRK